MTHDQELEMMRLKYDPAEQPEPVLAEYPDPEWYEALDMAFVDVCVDCGDDIAEAILDGKMPAWIVVRLRERLDAVLHERAVRT